MALVEYSDSDEADSPPQPSSRKRKHCDHDESDSTAAQNPIRHRKDSLANTTSTTTSRAPAPPSALPSLPPTFHSLYASNVRTSTSDDPSLHSGRTRQIPHMEGNWPTHIYLEWYPSPTELSTLRALTTCTQQSPNNDPKPTKPAAAPPLHSLLETDLGAQLPLHISLSAPLTLQTEQKAPFLDALERAITATTAAVKALTVRTGVLEWVANSDRTRWFLVLRVGSVQKTGNGVENGLGRLLMVCNDVVRGFGQPALYEREEWNTRTTTGRARARARARAGATSGSGLRKRKEAAAQEDKAAAARVDCAQSFHISIAWTLEDPGESRSSSATDPADIHINAMKIFFDAVKVKIGNLVHDIPLA